MEVKCLAPFLDAVKDTLGMFGVQDVKRGKIEKKSSLYTKNSVSSIVGITGKLRGDVAYSMSNSTALKVISTMMMGMPVEVIDDMGKSAIGELSNMITGHASMGLAQNGFEVNITPPAVKISSGEVETISKLETIAVELETTLGIIEVNISLEN